MDKLRARFGGLLDKAQTEGGDSSKASRFASRKSLIYEDKQVANMVAQRDTVKVFRNNADVTPKHIISYAGINIDDIDELQPLWVQTTRISRSSAIEAPDGASDKGLVALGTVPDVNDIIDEFESTPLEDTRPEKVEHEEEEHKMPHNMKIILRETDNISFYDTPSITVTKGSEEAKDVETDNAAYDYLAYGKGQNRRRSEAETQTSEVLYKSRSTNTERIQKFSVDTFVSNYDMFDTYADLARVTISVPLDSDEKFEITTYSNDDSEISKKIATNENFRLSSMVIERLLASNVFPKQQKRYRNMYPPDPLNPNAQYLYRFDTLWIYKTAETLRKAVSCVSWCEANHDILAVGHGVYSFIPQNNRREGCICIWSIKNPVNPERKYRYAHPVTACCFSKKNPQLLAVGCYDGSIEIIDIIKQDEATLSKSHRSTSPSYEPVWDIKWIPGEDSFGINEQVLAIFQDGRIMKYSFITGPYLLGYQQLRLTRVEGVVEGIPIVKKKDFVEANRFPQAFCMTMHPVKTDDYFVGTDEGCLHRSSINFPHQHKIQVHQGGVYAMEFSPWSPKIFLTCGSDWYIRIWVEDIFQPVCELLSGIGVIQYACWSPVNPTILASISKTRVEIWDLRRKTLKPAKIQSFGLDSEPLTVIRFTKDGLAVIVGDEEGKTYLCALEDMPFPPHYPYHELQCVLYKLMDANPELLKQVKSLGYLGY